MLTTALAGLIAGVLPALAAARSDISGTFRAAGHSSESSRQRGIRHLLVVAEFAFVFALSAVAGLLAKSFVKLLDVSPGFDAAQVVTGNLNSVSPRYPRAEDDVRFFTGVVRGVRSLPGVEDVAVTSVLPLSGNFDMTAFLVEGRNYDREADIPSADRYAVTPGYFSTMRIALKRGRIFTDADREGSPPVAIVSESAAPLFGGDPIGKRIRVGTSGGRAWAEVVGVVVNVRQYGLDVLPAPQFYLPLAQFPRGYMTIVARSPLSPETLLPAIRTAVERVDPTRALSKTGTLEHWLAASFAPRRFVLILVGAYAGLALVLAVVGLYGTMAYSIAARLPEIGIRVALGASQANVALLVLSQSLRLTSAGLAVGILLSLVTGRYTGSLLFGVSRFDPEVIGLAGVAMLISAASATVVPLRRALRVQLSSTLRCE
jgi:putative ABC transport system permease protein